MPRPPQDPLPPAIQASLELLTEGITDRSLKIIRRRMNDGGTQVVYDLAVGYPLASGEYHTFSIARMLPQPETDDGPRLFPPPTSTSVN